MRARFGTDGAALWAELAVADDVPLSALMPLLESVGYAVAGHDAHGSGAVRIHRFSLLAPPGEVDAATSARLAEALEACGVGRSEVDGLNELVQTAGLHWHEVAVLRACRHYHRHLPAAPAAAVVEEALRAEPGVAALLVALFRARFDAAWTGGVEQQRQKLAEAFEQVPRLEHEEALRSVAGVIEATVAANAFAPGAPGARPLALKLESARVPGMAPPVPYREVYVLSPDIEGVHLRAGAVARGGLRWSERAEDLRAEVLALMKAQVLKNALIVPTGAKGGFLVRRPAADRAALLAQVRDAYLAFVGALLDVTGEDDPYLVVAADKGTATFSDLANGLAVRRQFWLADAFASGGSAGYDHKALGITARGAWVAARQHLRGMDMRLGAEPITVAGIGDLSGDVFGNAMTRQEGLRLVAAFDHRDIFLDPDPDLDAAQAERRRLQALTPSSWQDYDRAVISAGGGVFSRALKRVPLSAEVRRLLRVQEEVLSPPELIRAILRAPVDVLFAGGIGTYVRAPGENDAVIGDRANARTRVTADELRARVWVEGANLSITQAARLHYARRGGRIHQDVIDNAAGVAISDREVNAKILLRVAGSGAPEAAEVLAACTDDVVAGVLEDVELQAVCLAHEQRRAPGAELAYERLMALREASGALDREGECLPGTAEMASRAEARAGLLTPELATLLAHAKQQVTAALLAGGVPDAPGMEGELAGAFAPRLLDCAGGALPSHPLRRELVATRLANDVVNRLGVTAPFELARSGEATLSAVVAAYWITREALGARAVWDALLRAQEALGMDRFLELKGQADALVATVTSGLLTEPGWRAGALAAPGELAAAWAADVQALLDGVAGLGGARRRQEREQAAQALTAELCDERAALVLASAPELALLPAVQRLMAEGWGALEAAGALLATGEQVGAWRLRRLLERPEVTGDWAAQQRHGLHQDVDGLWLTAATVVLRGGPGALTGALEGALSVLAAAEREDQPTLDAVAVAVRSVGRAVEGRAG